MSGRFASLGSFRLSSSKPAEHRGLKAAPFAPSTSAGQAQLGVSGGAPGEDSLWGGARRRWLPLLALLALAACPGVTAPSSPVGLRCAQHSECAELPEAYCAKAGVCTRECADAGCPVGSACVSRSARRVCLPTCGEGVTCVAGLTCVSGDAGFLCDMVDPLVAPPPK